MPDNWNPQRLTAVEFEQGSKPENPLPTPGKKYDGQYREELSALYPATQQTTQLVLTTSIAATDKLTLTITPIGTPTGLAWGDNLAPVVVEFTAATALLEDAAAGLVQALKDAQTSGSLNDISNFQRVTDIVLVSKTDEADANIADGLQLKATVPGGIFSVELTATGATTSTQTTTGAADELIPVGFVVMKDGYDENEIPIARLPKAGDTAANILGIVVDSSFCSPVEIGQKHRGYNRGKDLVYTPWGSGTAYAEKNVAIDAQLYIRLIAVGSLDEVGALTDTADGANTLAYPGVKTLRSSAKFGSCAYLASHP
jgi:hypothetical protein